MTDDAPAEDLAEVLARRFLTTDAARPEKVARWHGRGRRTPAAPPPWHPAGPRRPTLLLPAP